MQDNKQSDLRTSSVASTSGQESGQKQGEQSPPIPLCPSQVEEESSMDVTQRLLQTVPARSKSEQNRGGWPILAPSEDPQQNGGRQHILVPLDPLEDQEGRSVSTLPDSSQEAEEEATSNQLSVEEDPASSASQPASTAQGLFSISRSLDQKKKRLVVIGAALCVVALLSATVFYVLLKIAEGPNVTVYQVGVQNVSQSVGGGGIVFPNQQLDISYPVAERVVAVLVKAGDQVHTNQPLIRLDPSQLDAQIAQAANDVAAAQAYLNTVSNVGNSVTIAQAQQAYNNAKNKYEALVAEASSPTLHHGTLISPMSGVVTSVNVNPGAVFAANTPLLTIMDESIVIVHVKVPLSNLGQVHLGQPAIVTPSALPNLNFHGSVSSIIPQADPQTDTFEVWVQVVNSNRVLLPGMSAFVRIEAGGQALVVPRLAVLNPDHEAIVFVVRERHVYLQHVHVVGRSMNSVFVDSGLSADDKVVLVGLDKLQNGEKVHVTHVEGHAS